MEDNRTEEEFIAKIKAQLKAYGDGTFEFETRDIQRLLNMYEESERQLIERNKQYVYWIDAHSKAIEEIKILQGKLLELEE